MATGGPHDYNLLWARESSANRSDFQFTAEKIAQTWPGFPVNPTRPVGHALPMDLNRFPFPTPVLPVRSSRKRRGIGGYVNLSNYNSIP